jgi:hypothetical protein
MRVFVEVWVSAAPLAGRIYQLALITVSSCKENRTAAGDTHEDTRVGITAMENGICQWAMSKKVENYKAPPAGGLKREKTRWSFSNERKVGGWRNFDRTKNKIRCMERMKLTAHPSSISYLITSLVRIVLLLLADMRLSIYRIYTRRYTRYIL